MGIGTKLFGGGGGTGGIKKVADAAARLLLSPTQGDFVIQLDTNDLWYYNSALAWELYVEDTDNNDLDTVIQGLSDHLADTTDAHDASAISVVPAGAIASTDVQSALAELDGDITGHLGDAADAHDASAISFIPGGTIAATEVQAAITELDTETDGRLDALEAVSHVAVTIGAVGAAPNANGATLSTQALNLEPADATNPGVVTAAAQTLGGRKTLAGGDIVGDPGTEGTGINVGGTTYESTHKVSDIGGTNLAQSIFHRHSTTLGPLLVGARTNNDTTAHSNVANSQDVFSRYAVGFAGTNYKIFGYDMFAVNDTGTVSDTSAPGKYSLFLSPDGTVVPVIAMLVRPAVTTFPALAITAGASGYLGNASMTTTQRNAIAAPSNGMQIFNSSTQRVEIYQDGLWQSGSSYNIAAAQTPADASSITVLAYRRQILPVSGSGGAVTIADVLSGAANRDGDELVIMGTSDTNTVTLVSSTNIALNGSCVLGNKDMIELVLYGTWVEKSRSN